MAIMTSAKSIGDAIRKHREIQNLSQEKLAMMSGTSKAHIWRIENARVSTRLETLARIAKSLDVGLSELLTQ